MVKWVALFACVLCCAAGVLSLWSFSMAGVQVGPLEYWVLGLSDGAVSLSVVDSYPRPQFVFVGGLRPSSVTLLPRKIGPMFGCLAHLSMSGKETTWILPLWIPILVLGVLTFALFRSDRLGPPGHCPTCRYDLTGNTSGVCPECGGRRRWNRLCVRPLSHVRPWESVLT